MEGERNWIKFEFYGRVVFTEAVTTIELPVQRLPIDRELVAAATLHHVLFRFIWNRPPNHSLSRWNFYFRFFDCAWFSQKWIYPRSVEIWISNRSLVAVVVVFLCNFQLVDEGTARQWKRTVEYFAWQQQQQQRAMLRKVFLNLGFGVCFRIGGFFEESMT